MQLIVTPKYVDLDQIRSKKVYHNHKQGRTIKYGWQNLTKRPEIVDPT